MLLQLASEKFPLQLLAVQLPSMKLSFQLPLLLPLPLQMPLQLPATKSVVRNFIERSLSLQVPGITAGCGWNPRKGPNKIVSLCVKQATHAI